MPLSFVATKDSPTDVIFRRLSVLAPQHYRTWVRAGILATLLGYTLAFATIQLEQEWSQQAHPRELYVLVAALVAAWMERRGRLQLAALILLGAIWTELHLTLLTLGPRAAIGGVFPGVVTGVILFFGVNAGRFVALSSLASAPAFALAGPWLGVGPGVASGDLLYLVALEASTLGIALLLSLLMNTLDGVLGRADRDARRVRELIDGAPDAILAVNQHGNIEDCNPSAEALFGRSRAALIGSSFAELGLSDPYRPSSAGPVLLHTLGPQPREFLVQRRRERTGNGASAGSGGNGVPVQAAGGAVEPSGSPEGTAVEGIARSVTREDGARDCLVVLRDITQRKLAQERTASLERQLAHAKKLEALGKLAGGVAHDFNNLLMAVGGYGDALRRHPEQRVRDIGENLMGLRQRAAGLTGHLVAFARKGMTQPRTMDLAEAVRELPRLLQHLVGPTVKLEIDAPEPAFIQADPAQIEQVLLNLALNARDAMPEGGTLAIRCTERPELGRVELCVSDTGHGMDETTRQQAFEPFFTTKPRSRGTGLGLALVQGIMEASGGSVRLESSPGQGARFTLSFKALPRPIQSASGGRSLAL